MKNELKLTAIAFLVLLGIAFSGIGYAKREDKGEFPDTLMRFKMEQAGWPAGRTITVSSLFGDLDDGTSLTKEGDWYVASATGVSIYSDRPANALGGLWIITRHHYGP